MTGSVTATWPGLSIPFLTLITGSGRSATSTTLRLGALVSACSIRSDARAACIIATYSSSSRSPLAYHSRSAGVTAKPGRADLPRHQRKPQVRQRGRQVDAHEVPKWLTEL